MSSMQGLKFSACFSVRRDLVTFGGALTPKERYAVGFLQAGESDEAERLMQEMRAQGVNPDMYTYNSVMNSYAVTVSAPVGLVPSVASLALLVAMELLCRFASLSRDWPQASEQRRTRARCSRQAP